jgi:hypothetical protein
MPSATTHLQDLATSGLRDTTASRANAPKRIRGGIREFHRTSRTRRGTRTPVYNLLSVVPPRTIVLTAAALAMTVQARDGLARMPQAFRAAPSRPRFSKLRPRSDEASIETIFSRARLDHPSKNEGHATTSQDDAEREAGSPPVARSARRALGASGVARASTTLGETARPQGEARGRASAVAAG